MFEETPTCRAAWRQSLANTWIAAWGGPPAAQHKCEREVEFASESLGAPSSGPNGETSALANGNTPWHWR